jgi:hypothetical protein
MIPHDRYPGCVILHFFMSRDDAVMILNIDSRDGKQNDRRSAYQTR